MKQVWQACGELSGSIWFIMALPTLTKHATIHHPNLAAEVRLRHLVGALLKVEWMVL